VSLAHTSFGGALPAVNLGEVLAIYADVVQRPHLPEDQFDDARTVCIQEVRAVEDELSQKAMLELRRRHYGDPLGRSNHGTVESLEAASPSDVRRFFEQFFHPKDAILAVAGKIDWPRLLEQVEGLFGNWNGGQTPSMQEKHGKRGYFHVPHEAGETHLGVAYDSVAYRDPNYFQARSAIGVLSDGMSSRLFTEVREKRGLVYTVYASCHSLVDRGSVFAYAGTTTDKAQETLDVMLTELKRLKEGVQEDELARLKAHLKTSLIMQQESSRSRAGSIAGDWYHLGRIRPLDELQRLLNDVTCETVNRYLRSEPPPRYTVVSLGAKPVEVQV
jgi:predicted Zn-dependent peptidase